MSEELLTSGEAATYLGISRQQVHRLAQTEKLQAERAGEFWLFRRAELDRYKAEPKNKGGRPKKIALPSPSRLAAA